MRTFRKKILLGYGATLLLIILVLSRALFLILRLGRASESILRENYQSIQAAENMIDAFERQDSATLLILLEYVQQGASEFRENESLFLQWLGRAKDNITIPGEKEIVGALEKGYARYLSEISNLQLQYRSDRTKAANPYHEVVLPLLWSWKLRSFCQERGRKFTDLGDPDVDGETPQGRGHNVLIGADKRRPENREPYRSD